MPTNRTYNYRLDVYITRETREWLRRKSYNEDRPMTEIVREILEKEQREENSKNEI